MYAELCAKSNFSFLEGASHPEELVDQAVDLGLAGLGIVDDHGVYGLPKGYRIWKNLSEEKKSKLNYISGTELHLERDINSTVQATLGRKTKSIYLLAKNRAGYGLMCRMLTVSHAGKQKGEARLSWTEFESLLTQDSDSTRGLYFLLGEGLSSDLSWFKEYVPQSQLYLTLSRFLDGHDKRRFEAATIASRMHGVPIVATNEVRYHVKSRSRVQSIFASLRDKKTITQMGTRLISNQERYLKSPTQMKKLFEHFPEAIENTLKISESCTFSLSELRYRYPSEWIPGGYSAQKYLMELVERGKSHRYPGGVPADVEKQIQHELKMVDELGFADYFLTIWEIVEFARQKNILCQGRGSAANSVICYVLGITAVDPLRMNLLFERFLSTERGEPPDIDVDFEHERREEVIQHIYQKYGRHRAAMVSAVITYQRKLSTREVCKVLEVSLEDVKNEDSALRKRAEERGLDLAEAYEKATLPLKLSREIIGFPRHLSIHSGGFTLSADPIIETVPVEPARMEGRTIIQWDKYDLETIGLLKVDVLALGMLSAIRKTLDGVGMELTEIPAEDLKTYQMIQKAQTIGVFQIESRAQMNMLGRLQPQYFYDLVIQVAIVRPGPIVGKMVHPYLKRRKGLEKIEFSHPKLRSILGKTLGVPLFQEQVMRLAIELAGFTPGEADELRRAIGAWRSEGSIQKMGWRLMCGLQRSGMSADFSKRIFDQIRGFSKYGFPESHAASFALIVYASCYLKCHYPAHFIASVMNSQPMGFYSNYTLLNEARRSGVKVLPIDLNFSIWDNEVLSSTEDSFLRHANSIRIGFREVHGFSKKAFKTLLNEREMGGVFKSLDDFLNRVPLRLDYYNKLAYSDAFQSFGMKRREAIWKVLGHEFVPLKLSEGDQATFPFVHESQMQSIQSDFNALGLSLNDHPVDVIRRKYQKFIPQTNTSDVKRFRTGDRVLILGMLIVRQRPSTAKGTCFATLEDSFGLLDFIIHRKTYEKYADKFEHRSYFLAYGEVQRDGYSASVILKQIDTLEEALAKSGRRRSGNEEQKTVQQPLRDRAFR